MAIAKANKEYKQVSAGIMQAVCYASWDIGIQKKEYMGEYLEYHQVMLAFEGEEIDDRGERMKLNKFYTLSLGIKANLRKDLESWYGRTLTEKELADGIETDTLIGKNCMLNIVLSDKGKAKVTAVMPLMKNLTPMVAVNSPEMPEWVQKIKDKGRSVGEVGDMKGDAQEPMVVDEVE